MLKEARPNRDITGGVPKCRRNRVPRICPCSLVPLKMVFTYWQGVNIQRHLPQGRPWLSLSKSPYNRSPGIGGYKQCRPGQWGEVVRTLARLGFALPVLRSQTIMGVRFSNQPPNPTQTTPIHPTQPDTGIESEQANQFVGIQSIKSGLWVSPKCPQGPQFKSQLPCGRGPMVPRKRAGAC